MKNTYKSIALFLGCTLMLLASCQQKPKQEKTDDPPQQEEREVVKPPKSIISLEESKELYDNYTRNRVECIKTFEMERSDDENFEVARWSAYDFDEVKQYIAFVEQEAKKAKVDVSTLRFYFANYPNKEKFPDGKPVVHPRQNSIFIVPTIKVDGQNFGFYIGADGEAKLIKDKIQEYQKGLGETNSNTQKAYASFAPSLAPQGGDQSLTMNRGSSGPPPPGDF